MVEESCVVVLYLALQQPAAVGGQKGSRGPWLLLGGGNRAAAAGCHDCA